MIGELLINNLNKNDEKNEFGSKIILNKLSYGQTIRHKVILHVAAVQYYVTLRCVNYRSGIFFVNDFNFWNEKEEWLSLKNHMILFFEMIALLQTPFYWSWNLINLNQTDTESNKHNKRMTHMSRAYTFKITLFCDRLHHKSCKHLMWLVQNNFLLQSF